MTYDGETKRYVGDSSGWLYTNDRYHGTDQALMSFINLQPSAEVGLEISLCEYSLVYALTGLFDFQFG
jgi:hypothetical protein